MTCGFVTEPHFTKQPSLTTVSLLHPLYQTQFQKNLMYLAAIPDAHPQTPALPLQMAPHPSMQQGFYMQHPQAAAVAQQQEGKSHLTHIFAFAFLVCALLVSMLAG
ncbi:hypothetical protein TSUD_356030 [Trifolium subterraneum]|uniref:Uncharacterized protein n=1 Tax=Trifolium subterraneum TaxID=3900 RepID=A0A2Z6LXZ0_TRISU|nr:hypothetical protein TSUD_356030 [Trifolium subterraneum]